MQDTTLGPYRLATELGSGGMGRVWRAEVVKKTAGLEPGTFVAIKLVHPHLLATEGFFKRFLREAEMGKSVRHENVVRTYDSDQILVDGKLQSFLVMEYVEGQTLRALLAELGRAPEELCRHIGLMTASGLAAIHGAGVVHRDVKPENVLITRDHVVKVMDLGVARLADEQFRLSQSGAFVGSVQYAAPEQFQSAAGVDARADLHALGLILYELATSQHPYQADDFRTALRRVLDEAPRRCSEINPQLSPFFEEIVHTLLAKNRDDRIATAAELAQILSEGERSAWWKARAQAIRAATKRPLRRIHIPRETALYGRENELTRLRSFFDRASAGEGQVVLLEGEAGIGKSRLVDELVASLRQSGADINFLFGAYAMGGAATASGAFATAFREHIGDESLDAALREMLPQTPILVPAFAALLRGDTTPTGVEPLTKDSLQTVFVQSMRALAAERPTVLLVDDLHFAPDEGRALFAALALAAHGNRVLLIGTTRPGLDGAWTADLERSGVARMSLSRLGAKDLVHLLADTLKSDRLAVELVGRVALKSDGNPFFVFEILRGLRDGRFVTQRPDGAWVGTRVIDEIQIPSSVLELVQARVALLVTQERDLLDVAACVGFEFDPLLVGDVVAMPRIPLLKRLAQVERAHRIVRSMGERFVFDHHQVQQALYDGLPELLRREYHAAIGAALETRHAAAGKEPRDLDGRLCADLAEHFLKGALGDRAKRYVDAAMTHLEKGWQNDAASRLAERALTVPGLFTGAERARLLLRRAGRLDLLGRREQERAALDEAIALADFSGDVALGAQARRALGGHLWSMAAYAEAEPVLVAALELARVAGDRRTESAVTVGLAGVYWSHGRWDEARGQYERCIALARGAGDIAAEAAAIGGLSNVLHDTGRVLEALELRERHLALSQQIGDRRGEANSTGNLGNAYIALGRYDEAGAKYRRCLEIFREIGYRRGEALSLSNMGSLALSTGDRAGALVSLEACIELCRAIGERRTEASALQSLGVHALQTGNTAVAERFLTEALSIRRGIGHPDGVASSLMELGPLRIAEGRTSEGRAHLEEALGIGQSHSLPGICVVASASLALLPGGSPAAALSAFAANESHMAHGTKTEARFLLWRATGDPAHLAEAKRLLAFAAEHAPADCRGSIMENVPLNRAIAAAAAPREAR